MQVVIMQMQVCRAVESNISRWAASQQIRVEVTELAE